jgi:hypothetical protein
LSVPARETTLTGKWIVGELVPDPVGVRIPPEAWPGRYCLVAGLRDHAGPRTTAICEVEVR